jgi:hypothetical protein
VQPQRNRPQAALTVPVGLSRMAACPSRMAPYSRVMKATWMAYGWYGWLNGFPPPPPPPRSTAAAGALISCRQHRSATRCEGPSSTSKSACEVQSRHTKAPRDVEPNADIYMQPFGRRWHACVKWHTISSERAQLCTLRRHMRTVALKWCSYMHDTVESGPKRMPIAISRAKLSIGTSTHQYDSPWAL